MENLVLPFNSEAVQTLSQYCCPRCILRLSHVNNPEYYEFYLKFNFRLSEKEIEKLFNIDSSLNHIANNKFCSVCFGILGDNILKAEDPNSLTSLLKELIVNCEHEINRFCFSFSFPHSILIRQFSAIYVF